MNESTQTKSLEKEKKSRNVFAPIVISNDVDCEPGINYIEWTKIVKEKLKERERKMIFDRSNLVQFIINKVHHIILPKIMINFDKQT